MLAGALYDAEYQCRIIFPNSTVCPVPEDKFCDRMMCKVSETSCMSNGEPLYDGTKCGENKVTLRFEHLLAFTQSSLSVVLQAEVHRNGPASCSSKWWLG